MDSASVGRNAVESRRVAAHGPDLVRRLAVAGLTIALVVGLVSSQGGYFATSWGWATIASLTAIAAWLIVSGRSDLGRLDVALLVALALVVSWIAASIGWSLVPARSVQELERALVLLTGVTAVTIGARHRDVELLTAAVLGAITGVACYALGTRLFPHELDTFDPIAVYRLAAPIGYWNGLGIFCVMGILVGVGVAADARSDWVRAAGAATVVPLATALYFTYSRGSWIALGIGAALIVLLSPSRLRLAVAGAIAAVPASLAVLSASSSYALTHRGADLDAAAADGRRLVMLLAALAAVAAGLTLVSAALGRRLTPSRRVSVGFDLLLGVAVVAVAAIGLIRLGGPVDAVDRVWSSFEEPPVEAAVDLDERLFSLSNNGRLELWGAAWSIFDEHPWLGSGAGTFERQWEQRDDAVQRVRDAHGLYVETLAELGVVGLVLLVGALSVPLVAGALARRAALVPALAGAYAAFLIHAGVDWDWELAGVMLTALLLGALVVVAARSGTVRALPTGVRVAGATAALALGGVAGIGLAGNRALDQARQALERGDGPAAIRHAERAESLMGWSTAPWNARGRGQLIGGDAPAAAASFRRALEIDPDEWQSWLNLAVATSGRQQRIALARARALYPRGPEVERVAAEIRERAGDR